ncbi:hypothetical protein P9139_07835 [Curtobacterium flaccumfaciens]|nr:hypothetical protein P9139_07835 [Curtobacterium flaccumfaciens]
MSDVTWYSGDARVAAGQSEYVRHPRYSSCFRWNDAETRPPRSTASSGSWGR